MAFTALFTPKSMNAAQFDEVTRRLEEAGAGSPEGRLHQICYGSDDQLQVMGIWTSEEAFEKFGQMLMPIVQEIGIEVGKPTIAPVYSMK
ncbi:MAG TPA: hypothetical protein VJ183_11105 [Chloroflexia bacterium]|nr:hypothetical protein [Chloroflexia bacterium]